jgi:predicted transcriptional regulator
MAIKRMKIGIMSPSEMRARTIAIAKGEYVPRPSEPKIWFPSIESVAQLLNEDNREMLRAIESAQPASVAEAAKVVHRHAGNLSRTLKKLEQYGIVKMVAVKKSHGSGRPALKPIVQATDFEISTFSLRSHVIAHTKRKERIKQQA